MAAGQRGQARIGAFQLPVTRLPTGRQARRAWLGGLPWVEQLRYQCPSQPHLKQSLGSIDLGLTPGGWGMVDFIRSLCGDDVGLRAAAKA